MLEYHLMHSIVAFIVVYSALITKIPPGMRKHPKMLLRIWFQWFRLFEYTNDNTSTNSWKWIRRYRFCYGKEGDTIRYVDLCSNFFN